MYCRSAHARRHKKEEKLQYRTQSNARYPHICRSRCTLLLHLHKSMPCAAPKKSNAFFRLHFQKLRNFGSLRNGQCLSAIAQFPVQCAAIDPQGMGQRLQCSVLLCNSSLQFFRTIHFSTPFMVKFSLLIKFYYFYINLSISFRQKISQFCCKNAIFADFCCKDANFWNIS